MLRLAWFLVLLPVLAVAQPTITGVSGSIEHGEAITITGTGFGSKSPASPVVWDNFESGTVGQYISTPTIGEYHRVGAATSSGPGVVYSDSASYSGTKSAYQIKYNNNTALDGLATRWSDTEYGAKQSFAHMVTKNRSSHGDLLSGYNTKTLRLATWDGAPFHGSPNVFLALSGAGMMWFGCNQGSPAPGDLVYLDDYRVNGSEFNNAHDVWYSVAVWTKMSDMGVANGFAGRDFNGNVMQANNLENYGDWATRTGTRAAAFSCQMGIGDASWGEQWFGEVYADTTLARVAALHPAGGHPGGGPTAIQIPTAWSDTEITITFNSGYYQPEDVLYLYVWNADGQQSDAYPITIGGTLEAAQGTEIDSISVVGGFLGAAWIAPGPSLGTVAYYLLYIREDGGAWRRVGYSTGTEIAGIEVNFIESLSVQARAYNAAHVMISSSAETPWAP